MTAGPRASASFWLRPPSAAVGVLMVVAAAAFAVVSAVHFGLDVPAGFTTISDSFPGAAPPEALIAAVVATGATAVLRRRPNSRGVALATTGFAILGTSYGLTVTLNSSRTGDVIYHLTILAALLAVLTLLLLPTAGGICATKGLHE